MPAKKTPLRATIKSRLAGLNDQLQFFLFVVWDFVQMLSSLPPKVSELYTTEYLPINPHAKRIHRRLNDLDRFRSATRSVTFGTYFSTAYEVASSLFGSAFALIEEMNGPIRIPNKVNEGPEQHYRRTLSLNGYTEPPSELLNTFEYFRHRRNAFIHLSSTAKPAYLMLAKSDGKAINSYWGTTRDSLNFTSAKIDPCDEEETISSIKLLHIGIERLDAHLASILRESGIVAHYARRQFGDESVRVNADVVRSRQQKLTPIVGRDFGFTPSLSIMEDQVRKVSTQ
jgi:hypothetical protein